MSCEAEKSENEIKYQSSGTLLKMAMDEYTKERDRANALDNKASFFMTVIVGVATIFIPIIPFSNLLVFFETVGPCFLKCFVSIFLVGILIAFIVLSAAFRKFYDAYKLTDYMRPSLLCIVDSNNHTAQSDQLERGLSDHYKTVVDNNVNVNNRKCQSISDGVKFCGIGFIVLVTTAIGLIVIIGG